MADNVIEYKVSAVDDFSATHAALAAQYSGLGQKVDDLTGKMALNAAAAEEGGFSFEDLGARGEHALLRLGEAAANGSMASVPGAILHLTHSIGGMLGPIGFVTAAVFAGYEAWTKYTESNQKAAAAAAASVDDFTKTKDALEQEIDLLQKRNTLANMGITGQNDDATRTIGALQQRIKEETALVASLQNITVNEEFAKAATANLASDIERYNLLVAKAGERTELADALKNTKTEAEKLQEQITAATRAMTAQVMTFGMGSDAAKIYEFQMQGATNAQLKQLETMAQLHAAEEQSVKDKAESKAIVDSMETPLAKHNQRVQELTDLYNRGAISHDVYNKAIEDEAVKWDIAAAHSKEYMDSLNGLMAKLTVVERAHQRSVGDLTTQTANMMSTTMQTMASGIGHAVASSIIYAKSLGDMLDKLLMQVAERIIATLVEIGVQQAIFAALGTASNKSMATGEITSQAGVAYAGTYAQVMMNVPWPFSVAVAPTAAMAAAAGLEAGSMPFLAVAHGGMDYVPAESTYLLDKGERVLSPTQNRDLTNFLKGGDQNRPTQNMSIATLHVHVLENAVNANAFAGMNKVQLRAALGQPVIDALNEMYKTGKRPDFAMQRK